MRIRIGIGIGIGDIGGTPADPEGLVAQARRAEAEGFTSGWLAHIRGLDAVMGRALRAGDDPHGARDGGGADLSAPSDGTRAAGRSPRRRSRAAGSRSAG
jgi:hypothetical protein